ncbi:MAG: NAD-dependent epimerase/dehydratase [Collimonas fungivorans]|uniref:NAD-dependent epimerase/dehydratase family protein n=1 Tax=Collimonas fungivorans TaxID=158899 RepID=UPI0026EF81EB|nr:NAD-dependent epimerase/dehydratase family protein [Collimonas fungivorans]MDB5769263.1 NAD-dependent epimerase/dehydratase [Collimonas fungivorans]
MKKILVIGANGQIGTELTTALVKLHGAKQVVASDIQALGRHQELAYEKLDVTDAKHLAEVVQQHDIGEIYHLAAALSAKGEEHPEWAWNLNMTGLLNVLEVARQAKLSKVFWPSSIAAFGPSTPRDNAPQVGAMDPKTVYGISKLAGEHWCSWYAEKYGMDIRSLRYPGLISYSAEPGGGTTDYAIQALFAAAAGDDYTSFLDVDSTLPMMYMPDAVRATIELMSAPKEQLKVAGSYNLAAWSFSPRELVAIIRQHYPSFSITYQPDFRQAIADAWPRSIDDSKAREEWSWSPAYSLADMVDDMLAHLAARKSAIQEQVA